MNRTLSTLMVCGIVALAVVPVVTEANSGDFNGGVAIGTGYAGIDTAPTNGLIVQGNVGIGTTSPLSGTALNVNGVADANTLMLNGAQVPLTPGGRLTVSSNTPVMTADVTGASTVYYADYINDLVPNYNGTNWVEYPLGGQISLALDSNSAHTGYQQSGKLFDVVLYDNSGTLDLCTGPAWTNSSTRASSVTTLNGIKVNSGTWTLKCDTTSSTFSCSTNQCTVVGTLYATANGQTGFSCHPAAAAGGTASYIAFANTYNSVSVNCIDQDSTHAWTYSTSTWRAADNSSSNSVSVVDPLGTVSVRGSYLTAGANTTAGDCAYVGVSRNRTNGEDFAGLACGPTNTTGNNIGPLIAYGGWAPLQGYNSYYAVEYVSSGTEAFNSGNNMYLQIDTAY